MKSIYMFFEKKVLRITVIWGIVAIVIAMWMSNPNRFSEKLAAGYVLVLFLIALVFYVLYLKAYEKETNDHTLWNTESALKRIPAIRKGAYKRNNLVLNFYQWTVLSFSSLIGMFLRNVRK